MKKYLVIMLLLFLTGCHEQTTFSEKLPFEDNSITFFKQDKNISLLINTNNKTTLLILASYNETYEDETLNQVAINNLVTKDNYITNLDYENKYQLDSTLKLDNLIIAVTDKITINLNNYLFCIYDASLDQDNYKTCDFIYLLNSNKNLNITLNKNMKALFYNEYSTFSNHFLEHLYTTWVDTYIISSNELISLVLMDKDYIVKNYVK